MSHQIPIAEYVGEPGCSGVCRTCPAVGTCSDRIVCRCLKITEAAIIGAIRDSGADSLSELIYVTGAGDGCTCCHRELTTYLKVYSSPETLIEAS